MAAAYWRVHINVSLQNLKSTRLRSWLQKIQSSWKGRPLPSRHVQSGCFCAWCCETWLILVVLWSFRCQHHAVNFEKLAQHGSTWLNLLRLRRSHRVEAVFVASLVVWLLDCTGPIRSTVLVRGRAFGAPAHHTDAI